MTIFTAIFPGGAGFAGTECMFTDNICEISKDLNLPHCNAVEVS